MRLPVRLALVAAAVLVLGAVTAHAQVTDPGTGGPNSPAKTTTRTTVGSTRYVQPWRVAPVWIPSISWGSFALPIYVPARPWQAWSKV